MNGLRCSPRGSVLGGFATVGSLSVSVGTGQGLVVIEKKMKNYNMAETGTMIKAGNWYGKVDNLWDELEFILVGILQYSGHFANFFGYSKVFEVFSKFLVDISSQCFFVSDTQEGEISRIQYPLEVIISSIFM